MHFTGILSLALALAAPVIGYPSALERRDGCHRSNDSIGKTCAFADKESFLDAAQKYCARFSFGTTVPEGGSYGIKFTNVDDGFGGHQIFWGNHRVDRGGDLSITNKVCMAQMETIFESCGGYGGWVNTNFGTVFGECIRE